MLIVEVWCSLELAGRAKKAFINYISLLCCSLVVFSLLLKGGYWLGIIQQTKNFNLRQNGNDHNA
jgi:hypothetical protein